MDAYQRKTERNRELVDTITDMEQHYEHKCQENEQQAATIAELEVGDHKSSLFFASLLLILLHPSWLG